MPTPFDGKNILVFNSYLLLLRDLKFPIRKYEGREFYEVGRHQWMTSEFHPGVKFYEWNFFKPVKETEWENWSTGVEVPDIWCKVNGVWQIIY